MYGCSSTFPPLSDRPCWYRCTPVTSHSPTDELRGNMGLLCLTVAVLVEAAYAGLCLPGQRSFAHSCYQLLPHPMTWPEARPACKELGSSVAVPNSPAEHQFIWQMFRESISEGSLWTGCSGTSETNGFQPDEASKQCNYFDWAPGQPSRNSVSNVCIQMWSYLGGLYDDVSCSYGDHLYTICESVATSPPALCLEAGQDGHFASPCLAGYAFKEFPTLSAMECGSACHQHPNCRSINLLWGDSQGKKICQLNNISSDLAPAWARLQTDNCTYFSI